MKKLLLLLGCSFIFLNTYSQNTNTKYWVELKDKNNNPFTVANPQAYLSQRAIDRRVRQHISITSSDLPINPSYILDLSNAGAVVTNKSKWLNAVVIELPKSVSIETIKALPCVKKITVLNVENNTRVVSKFETLTGANEEILSETKSSSATEEDVFNYGTLSTNQVSQIRANCLHNEGYTGKGMVIAQLDAGYYNVDILPAFKRMRDNNQILGTRDFVAGGTSVYEDHNHGEAVLSLMGGYIDGYLIGTAPDAKFWLIRTEDAATEYIQEEVFWTLGAEFADSVGADIINSSLGYSKFDDSSTDHTYADMDGNTTIVTKAADMAASKGILVVCSAGNSGGSPWFKITAPADADSILTVGAVDSIGVITGFSGRGLTSDGRIKPDVCAKGSNVTYAWQNGGLGFGGGTSFSSPLTAGAVACLWQANPTKTNMQLIKVIQTYSNRFASPDSIYGYGIPDFCKMNAYINESTMSIDEYESTEVYPNPFHDFFQINFYSENDETVLIELFDVAGKKNRSQQNDALAYEFNVFMIDETLLSAGMYFIKVKTSEKTIVKKIIKN